MANQLNTPFAPRNGRVLRVLGIVRISTEHQDAKSLDDQEALLRRYVADNFDGSVDCTIISSRGSGEYLDRAEVAQAEELVESQAFDLVILEDLGRHVRRMAALIFCELCQDADTRLIAINDHLDTAKPDWRLHAFFATMRHELYNADTAQRIRRTMRNRFTNGGIVQFTIFGYVKPRGAKSDDELHKDPDAESVYAEWFRLLDSGASYAETADWLNASGIPTGPYCRTKQWTGPMVARITHNPLLKGLRVRNRKVARRVNKNGRRRSVHAPPEELLERYCQHLAFFTAEYYDRVVRIADERNARYRAGRNGHDSRRGRPRRRTVWPGQHLFCGICGRMLRYGGHGQNDHLMCGGAYDYSCWMGITADGPLAASKIAAAVIAEIERLPDFEEGFANRLYDEVQTLQSRNDVRLREIARDDQRIDRQLANIRKALAEYGPSQTLLAELRELETGKLRIADERRGLENLTEPSIEIPSMSEVRQLVRQSFDGLATTSEKFSSLIRQLIPRIEVFPFRLVDGGHIMLRAYFTLNLAPMIGAARHLPALDDVLQREMVVDLFDPPQRVRFREQVLSLRSRFGERKTAAMLGITVTAAQRAANLTRIMQRMGVTDAYVQVIEPPGDYSKLCRHKHPRYKFLRKDQGDVASE